MKEKGPACRQAGLTLLEIIIAMGISTMIGVLLLVIIVNSTGIFYNQSARLTEGLNSNDALTQIRRDIKQASSIAASYVAGPDVYTSSDTQLVFKVSAIDSSSNIIPDLYDYFVYFIDQNQLRLKIFPSGLSSRKARDQIFSTNVDSLKFQYLDLANPPQEVAPTAAVKVRITLILKQKSGANYEISIATSEANLRND